MNKGKIAMGGRLGITAALLMLGLGPTAAAYEQGSYFLFDVRDAAKTGDAAIARIFVNPDVFKAKKLETKKDIAGKKEKSEFEMEISSFRTDAGGSVDTGIGILDEQKDDSKSESTFGEETPASGGFYFSY
jgi:hypothetical protein